MKIYARLENERGKIEGMGGNEYLDIDVMIGNTRLAALTIRRAEIPELEGAEGWVMFDADNQPLNWIIDTIPAPYSGLVEKIEGIPGKVNAQRK